MRFLSRILKLDKNNRFRKTCEFIGEIALSTCKVVLGLNPANEDTNNSPKYEVLCSEVTECISYLERMINSDDVDMGTLEHSIDIKESSSDDINSQSNLMPSNQQPIKTRNVSHELRKAIQALYEKKKNLSTAVKYVVKINNDILGEQSNNVALIEEVQSTRSRKGESEVCRGITDRIRTFIDNTKKYVSSYESFVNEVLCLFSEAEKKNPDSKKYSTAECYNLVDSKKNKDKLEVAKKKIKQNKDGYSNLIKVMASNLKYSNKFTNKIWHYIPLNGKKQIIEFDNGNVCEDNFKSFSEILKRNQDETERTLHSYIERENKLKKNYRELLEDETSKRLYEEKRTIVLGKIIELAQEDEKKTKTILSEIQVNMKNNDIYEEPIKIDEETFSGVEEVLKGQTSASIKVEDKEGEGEENPIEVQKEYDFEGEYKEKTSRLLSINKSKRKIIKALNDFISKQILAMKGAYPKEIKQVEDAFTKMKDYADNLHDLFNEFQSKEDIFSEQREEDAELTKKLVKTLNQNLYLEVKAFVYRGIKNELMRMEDFKIKQFSSIMVAISDWYKHGQSEKCEEVLDYLQNELKNCMFLNATKYIHKIQKANEMELTDSEAIQNSLIDGYDEEQAKKWIGEALKVWIKIFECDYGVEICYPEKLLPFDCHYYQDVLEKNRLVVNTVEEAGLKWVTMNKPIIPAKVTCSLKKDKK